MKKVLSILIAAAILAPYASTSLSVSAAEVDVPTVSAIEEKLLLPAVGTEIKADSSSETEGNFTYSVLDDGTVEITSYNGESGDVVIPDTVDGKSVTSIGSYAFKLRPDVTSVSIPSSVNSIGKAAFYGCSGLKDISLPEGLTNIETLTFAYCSSLTSVVVPNGVTSIGSDAFAYCSGLTDVLIPDSVTSIGIEAFVYCSGLSNVTVPNGVKSIGAYAFGSCSGLTNVTVPGSVSSIGNFAFYNSGNPSISGATGSYAEAYAADNNIEFVVLEDIDGEIASVLNELDFDYRVLDDGTVETLKYTGNDKDVVIPDTIDGKTVTSIGDGTFYNRTDLTSVAIPDSITNVADGAFSYCTALTSVNFSEKLESINYGAFAGCSALVSIDIPESVSSVGIAAFSKCTALKSITLPENVTSIEAFAFANCTELTDVTIPKNVTTIELGAFGSCSALTEIDIPDSVTKIGYGAFANCASLNSVTVPDSVTDIEDKVFEGSEDVIIFANEGSYAEKYASETNTKFVATGIKVLLGDVNGDGSVSALDAFIARRAMLEIEQLTPESFAAADINGDGIITVDEPLDIQRYTVELKTAYDFGTIIVPVD